MKRLSRQYMILIVLHKLNIHYSKLYCYPSQKRIVELLDTFSLASICRSTLNYWLRSLESEGLIVRRQRHRRHPKYGWEFHSTLYEITLSGYYILRNMEVNVSKQIGILRKMLMDAVHGKFDRRSRVFSSGKMTGLDDVIEKVQGLMAPI